MSREIDALVAKAMGWTEIHFDKDVGQVGIRPNGRRAKDWYICRPENWQENRCPIYLSYL